MSKTIQTTNYLFQIDDNVLQSNENVEKYSVCSKNIIEIKTDPISCDSVSDPNLAPKETSRFITFIEPCNNVKAVEIYAHKIVKSIEEPLHLKNTENDLKIPDPNLDPNLAPKEPAIQPPRFRYIAPKPTSNSDGNLTFDIFPPGVNISHKN